MGNSVLDTGFSGEDLMLKTRKPYTITKQRERWTEEEHNRFLEALKKHGRAWQRIEEHIGTKTAVQIRSHAQKFFSKLEREALNKGLSISKAHDIEVPPPRPKKKPSNPYPRKISMAASTSSQADSKNKCVSSPKCSKLVLNFENDPTIQPSGVFDKECTETGSTQRNTKEMSEGNDSPEVLTLFEDAPCASISSASKKTTTRSLVLAPPNPGAFREFIPTMKEVSDQAQMDEVSTVAESKGKLKLDRADADNTNLEIGTLQGFKLENHFLNLHAEAAPLELNPMENPDLASKEMQIQSTAGYPRHVPVQVLDGNNMEICLPTQSPNLANSASMVPQLGIHGTPSTFKNQTVSATSELHKNSAGSAACPPFSIFRPHFTQFHGNADTHKLPTPACAVNISSTLSSLIISNLLQNPAAHAAASLAASCWPCTDMGNSADGGLLGYMNPSPSIAAVAAATVAAATAWWATHGPLPFCPPHPTSFAFAPTPSTTTIPLTETSPFPLSEDTEERKQKQPPCTEFSATLGPKHEASASQPLTSSGSEESLGIDPDGTKPETEGARQEMLLTCTGSDPEKPRKQVDRSSCGSNTSSSSEVETDAVLEKQGEREKEASKEAEFIHPESELSNRRSRTVGNINDSWKEVSEEGRLAFRALFSRQVLPQSFSPPQDIRNKLHPNSAMEEKDKNPIKKDEDKAQLDLNDSAFPLTRKKDAHLSRSNADKGSVGHVKLKARQTGFEPYKRCSVEAKEETTRVVSGIASQTEERSAKRIRLEGKVAM